MSKVLFLDFDGVLNSVRFFNAPSKRKFRKLKAAAKWGYDPRTALDPAAVERLNAIVERTGCKVVISSSWRVPFTVEEIASFLADVGFRGEVAGATPVDVILPVGAEVAERGHEIAAWLDAHPEVEAFAIVDDFGDMAHLKPRLVQTDTQLGMQGEHVEAIVALLSEPTSGRRG